MTGAINSDVNIHEGPSLERVFEFLDGLSVWTRGDTPLEPAHRPIIVGSAACHLAGKWMFLLTGATSLSFVL